MIVILTALPVEQEAVLEHLVDVREHRHAQGTLFDVGTLAGRPDRRVALGVTGQGTLAAAALTERAIAEFSPSAVLFSGIAGGLRPKLEIGDVVVATKVYAYHGGKSEDEEFLVRPRSWEISHDLEQLARRIRRTRAWCEPLAPPGEAQRPEVHFEAIAAGDVVLNSTTSPVANALHRNYNDAVAVEMESAGSALAAHLAGRVATATVRGISDHADGTKSVTDGQGGQRRAARNAAAFTVALAAAIHEAPENARKTAGQLPPIRNRNMASTGATVGQQNGVNTGDFTMNVTRENR
ncbi:5'-methylthioadenosine/S-adenosylhomocysteine nucleosidase [Lentzea albidocapillata]|uniref:Nucleoside phosphorylase n=1 Tax=Lentzea albidocapillata TaxID=40571 RepID=A0A1W2FGA8_9PSEU|nr:5'-methylthioadenosine/S-adenosylhomocysteine nucleosidase [Lentzea albidocapillata]SMD20961.1 Nucleoside phosphorylase [Lentzea albidocapillata]